MIRTSLEMKEPAIDELILQTVIYSSSFENIFSPFKLNSEGVPEIQVTKAKKLTIDLAFCLTEEKELRYLVDLVEAAAILTEISPQRLAPKFKPYFATDVCLAIAKDQSLNGALRGAFILLFRNLHILSVLSDYEIFSFETNILLPQEEFSFFRNRKSRVQHFRYQILKTANYDFLSLILAPIDFTQPQANILAKSVLETVIFFLENNILQEEEIQTFDQNLK
jgi:hypothetical protein